MSTVTKRGCNPEEDIELRRGPWTLEEDTLLIHYIACHGEGRWNLVARCSGLKRTGKSCRLRWLNYLKPDVKRGNLTPEEQLVILELHSKWGNRWSKIAQHLPGRTDNEIKNYWRTRVQRQARQLKIETNSARFRDVVRWFLMPKLLQKMPYQSSIQSLNSTPIQLNTPPESLSFIEQNTLNNPYYSDKPISEGWSPSICSDSLNITQFPQISEFPATPQDFGYIDHSPLLKESYNSCESEAIQLASIATPGFNYPYYDSSMTENTCIDDMGDSLWNMDEFWQLQKLQGRSI
ncbi:hypothetical protein AAC387_Pa05g2991 [Persea americana]